MRKILILVLLLEPIVCIFAQEKATTLNQAIKDSITYLAGRLPPGSKVAVLNFSAPTDSLSNYVIEELTTHIVNNGNVTVVDRQNLELLQQEMNFQMSGEVSDATAQAIGQKLGAQTIVSGSFTPLGNVYRMVVRAIKVETAEVQGQQPQTVALDATLAVLLGITYTVPDFSPGRRIGAGFLNTIVGLGSFTMGDWPGGLILTAGYAIAAGLIVWDVVGFSYDDELAGIPGAIGFGVAGVTALYGFIRPFTYHKPTPKNTLAEALRGMHISVISGKEGIKVVRVSYTYRF